MVKSNAKLWKVILGGLCVCIVALGVGILIVTGKGTQEVDNDILMYEIEEIQYINSISEDIAYSFENDPNYTEYEMRRDFEKLINDKQGDEKSYAVAEYAHFIYDETGDLNEAVALMESISEDVSEGSRAGYYISFSNLYKKAGMDDEARKYYDLAVQIYGGTERNE